MQTISNLWQSLERWARDNAPDMLSNLNGPAADGEVASIEASIGSSLPGYYKQLVAIHNGEIGSAPCVFADWGRFLPLDQMVSEWRARLQHACNEEFEGIEQDLVSNGIVDITGPVQLKHFLPTWIPIMESNGDVFWAMDFSPAPGGENGQIIEVDWECNSWKVIARSFPEFLGDYVAGLQNGDFVVHDGLPTIKNP